MNTTTINGLSDYVIRSVITDTDEQEEGFQFTFRKVTLDRADKFARKNSAFLRTQEVQLLHSGRIVDRYKAGVSIGGAQ